MSKLLTTIVAASFLSFGATSLMAQSSTTTQDTPPAAKKSGEVKDEKPTDPNTPRQSDIKKLEKEDRAGKSTGN